MKPLKIGYGLNLHKDRDLVLSDSQVLDNTADTKSTNTIEMGSINFPKGNLLRVNIFIAALVGTLTIKLCGSSDGADPEATDVLETKVVDAGETGVISFTLAQTDEVDRVNLFYSAGTSATISASMTAEA